MRIFTLLKITRTIIPFFLIVNCVIGQEYLPFGAEFTRKPVIVQEPWLAPMTGFVPKANALRLNIVSGNLLFNRMGGYVSIEKEFSSEYFTNIYGFTATVNRHIYLWGGIDLFSRHGIFSSLKGTRKEIGLGVVLLQNLIASGGWSKSVNFTFSFGWKLPLFKDG